VRLTLYRDQKQKKMARITENTLGRLSGKVGGLVFKQSEFGDYVSAMPSATQHKPSLAQRRQRNRMRLCMDFIKGVGHIIQHVYLPTASTRTRHNQLKSHLLKNAMQSTGKGLSLIYSQVMLSRGDLRPLMLKQLENLGAGEYGLKFDPQLNQAMTHADDQVFLVLYRPAQPQFHWSPLLGYRTAASIRFSTPKVWPSGEPLHAWVGFFNPTLSEASISTYLGEIVS
jgi:hypothetical protein